MHVVHTAGQPPNHGRMNLLIKGCTWNSRKALKRIVAAKAKPGQSCDRGEEVFEIMVCGFMGWADAGETRNQSCFQMP